MTLTFEDLKASIGKGPCLDSDDIANTYYSDEEFLNALTAKTRSGSGCNPQGEPSKRCVNWAHAQNR